MSNCGCSCQSAPKFVFSCSGAADVGEVADQAAQKVVAVDGCPLNCARKTLEEAGFTEFDHIQLGDLGFKKGETPATPENIGAVIKEISKRFQG